MQEPGAVTGQCILCPTGRVLPAEKISNFRRRLQIPGGDSESDNYNQRKLGGAVKVEKKTECDDFSLRKCEDCPSKPQQHQK